MSSVYESRAHNILYILLMLLSVASVMFFFGFRIILSELLKLTVISEIKSVLKVKEMIYDLYILLMR